MSTIASKLVRAEGGCQLVLPIRRTECPLAHPNLQLNFDDSLSPFGTHAGNGLAWAMTLHGQDVIREVTTRLILLSLEHE